MDNTFYLIVKQEDNGSLATTSQSPKKSSAEKKKEKETKEWVGVAKQAAGYVPGVGDAVSTIDTGMSLMSSMSAGGAMPVIAAVSLALSLAKKAHDIAIQVRNENTQQTEIRRRAGYQDKR